MLWIHGTLYLTMLPSRASLTWCNLRRGSLPSNMYACLHRRRQWLWCKCYMGGRDSLAGHYQRIVVDSSPKWFSHPGVPTSMDEDIRRQGAWALPSLGVRLLWGIVGGVCQHKDTQKSRGCIEGGLVEIGWWQDNWNCKQSTNFIILK